MYMKIKNKTFQINEEELERLLMTIITKQENIIVYANMKNDYIGFYNPQTHILNNKDCEILFQLNQETYYTEDITDPKELSYYLIKDEIEHWLSIIEDRLENKIENTSKNNDLIPLKQKCSRNNCYTK